MSKERIAVFITQDDSLASFVKVDLSQLDCTVLVTESPQRVIRSCSSNLFRPDLVIVDEENYPKPNQDWSQLFQSVQEAGIPKILLTNRNGNFSGWDAVYDRSLMNPLWKSKCMDLLNQDLYQTNQELDTTTIIQTEEVAATMEIAVEIVETVETVEALEMEEIVEAAETAVTSRIGQRLFLGIVDDDSIVRKMLGEHFSVMPDIEIQTFREGESFLEDEWHQQDGQFLLIIDGNMPRIDGYEVVYRLRKEYDWNKYRILMLTGRKSEQDIVRAFELGVDDYLTKPFKLSELDARVKRYIQRWER